MLLRGTRHETVIAVAGPFVYETCISTSRVFLQPANHRVEGGMRIGRLTGRTRLGPCSRPSSVGSGPLDLPGPDLATPVRMQDAPGEIPAAA